MTGWRKRPDVPTGIAVASSGRAARMLAKVRRIVGPQVLVISLQIVEVDTNGVTQYQTAKFAAKGAA